MGLYPLDRSRADRFLPEVVQILAPFIIKPAGFEEDVKRATDLIIADGRVPKIAVRIRAHEFLSRYPTQFTIRTRRDSGAETELSKITNSWGDWFFYGFENHDGTGIAAWRLIDLHAFRAALIREKQMDLRLGGEEIPNGDGTHFVAFDILKFPTHPPHPPLLIAASPPLDQLARIWQ